MTISLVITQKQASKLMKQMGKYAFIKWCKNLGIDAEDCIILVTGKMPTVVNKPHLFVPYLQAA